MPENLSQPLPESFDHFEGLGEEAPLLPDRQRTIEIDAASETPLAVSGNEDTQTYQELYMVVQDDDESFGVIRCHTPWNQFDVVVRWGEDGQAHVAGGFRDGLGDAKIVDTGRYNPPRQAQAAFSMDGKALQVENLSHEKPLDVRQQKYKLPAEEVPVSENAPWALSPRDVDMLSIQHSIGSALYNDTGPRNDEAIGLARDPGAAPEKTEVLLNGTLNGERIGVPQHDCDARSQRHYWASVLDRDPQTAEVMARNKMVAVHAARSSTLGSMVEFGGQLKSAAQIVEDAEDSFFINGGDSFSVGSAALDRISFSVLTVSGTEWSLGHYGRVAHSQEKTIEDLQATLHKVERVIVSGKQDERYRERGKMFADGLTRAIAYIEEHPDSDYAQLALDDFPVAFLASREAVYKVDEGYSDDRSLFHYDQSSMDEIRPARRQLSLGEDLPVVAVPEEKVSMVQAMFARRGYTAEVVPIEGLVPPPRKPAV